VIAPTATSDDSRAACAVVRETGRKPMAARRGSSENACSSAIANRAMESSSAPFR
jgi:hypothetical protein